MLVQLRRIARLFDRTIPCLHSAIGGLTLPATIVFRTGSTPTHTKRRYIQRLRRYSGGLAWLTLTNHHLTRHSRNSSSGWSLCSTSRPPSPLASATRLI